MPLKRTFADAFRQPFAPKADIIMSIRPEHMANIASGVKNHEYRKYLLPSCVKRIWFFTTYPASRVEYVAQIGRGRKPGEVPEDGGLGNENFNAGRKESKYAYEIVGLWKLSTPLTVQEAKRKGILKAPPQKYNYARRELVEGWPLGAMRCIIERRRKTGKVQSEENVQGGQGSVAPVNGAQRDERGQEGKKLFHSPGVEEEKSHRAEVT